jgi:Antitoxin SocA-like, Panacea domain
MPMTKIKPRLEGLTFSYPVPRAKQRFRELIVYISDRYREAELFGAAKLNKTLYCADFRAFERFGVPLTGASYFALKKGPAPKIILPVLKALVDEGAVTIEERQFGNHLQKRVVPHRRAFLDLFTRDEIALVDEVIKELWDQGAEEAASASDDVRWRTLQLNDLIPYEAAFLSQEPLTDGDLARTARLADEYGWK